MIRPFLLTASVFCCIPLMSAYSEDKPKATAVDQDFLIRAATCNQAEIEISKMAQTRAQDENVKNFATASVKDHQALMDSLARLLKFRKTGVVAGLESETKEELNRLAKLEGADFDRAFLECYVGHHQKNISMYEHQIAQGKESDITSYARDAIPHFKRHMEEAQKLQKKSK